MAAEMTGVSGKQPPPSMLRMIGDCTGAGRPDMWVKCNRCGHRINGRYPAETTRLLAQHKWKMHGGFHSRGHGRDSNGV